MLMAQDRLDYERIVWDRIFNPKEPEPEVTKSTEPWPGEGLPYPNDLPSDLHIPALDEPWETTRGRSFSTYFGVVVGHFRKFFRRPEHGQEPPVPRPQFPDAET